MISFYKTDKPIRCGQCGKVVNAATRTQRFCKPCSNSRRKTKLKAYNQKQKQKQKDHGRI